MTSVSTSRRQGLNSSAAIKVPCVVATTGNITLSALQTVDGVALAAGDRVLVKDQTTQSENGVYVADTGNWTRDLDFDGAYDVVEGTIVTVLHGNTYTKTLWMVSTVSPSIGSALAFIVSSLSPTDSNSVDFLQAGAGAVTRTLQSKERDIVSVKDFGAVGDGATDDYAAIVVAVTAAKAAGKTLVFPDGHYKHSGTLEFAASFFNVEASGADVWLEHTGTGVGVSLNGLTYHATQGAYRFFFGGKFPFNISGNANTTIGLYYNNIHWSDVYAMVRNAQVPVKGDKTGGGTAAAVGSKFRIGIGNYDLGAITVAQQVGMYLTETYASTFYDCQSEVSGNAAGNFGIYITTSNGNTFVGGTAESNNFGGVWVTSTAHRNTFINFHSEANGQGPDWQIDGNYTHLINCAGVATYATLATSANIITGDYTVIDGGEFNDLEITAAADNTRVIGANLATGTLADNSLTTTFEGCSGVTDKAPPPVLTALTLTGGFSNAGAPYKVCSHFRSRSGQVQVEGVMITGTIAGPTVVATLPANYRPSATVLYTGYNLTTNLAIGLTINSSGQIATRAGVTTGDYIAITSPPFRV